MDELREKLKNIRLSIVKPDGLVIYPENPELTLGKLINAHDIEKIMALIASYSREAELKGQIKAFRSVPQIDVDLEQWLWEQIDPLEAELKALGAKPEGKPNE